MVVLRCALSVLPSFCLTVRSRWSLRDPKPPPSASLAYRIVGATSLVASDLLPNRASTFSPKLIIRTRNRTCRWSNVITHVPCGGSANFPAGRLLISSTLTEIDGVGGTLGSAGPGSVWSSCNTISAEGTMTFDIDDIADLEAAGTFEGVILHEMGHVIGIG